MADFNFFLNRQGPKGARGVKGDTGFSPTITPSADNDGLTTYKLVITNENNTYETDNLMGNLDIVDDGGTYLRYNREAGSVSASEADAATASAAGVVRLANSTDYANLADDAVMTPSSFVDNYNNLLSAGIGIEIGQNLVNDKITIGISNDVVTNTDLSSALSDYVKNSVLNGILANYITDASLTTTLFNYVTNSNLTTILDNYATQQWVRTNANALYSAMQTWVTNQGYTSNVGTVTSVNNTLPDANGNVTISAGGGAVNSVNGQTGTVVLTASDVGALPDSTTIPTKTSDLTNDSNFAQNTATATNSLTILGTTNNQSNSILIGYGTTTYGSNSTIIGSTATGNGYGATALGYYARANDRRATAIGESSYASYNDSTAIGHNSQATKAGTLAVGSNSKATGATTTAVGYLTEASANAATALGYEAKATAATATALGYEAKAKAIGALQIGEGTNNTANTLQVSSYTLLDTSTGLIPDARISTTIDRISAIESRLSAIEAALNQ